MIEAGETRRFSYHRAGMKTYFGLLLVALFLGCIVLPTLRND
jgi:hypothetical protein